MFFIAVVIMFKLIIITLFLMKTLANTRCVIESTSNFPKYNFIEKCHRSTLGITASANFTTLSNCKRLGMQKMALALNFSPQVAYNKSDPADTCEVLKCAEEEGGFMLRNDSRYDYYSIYGKLFPRINSTCVPGLGMFFLLPKKLNFTQAETKCKNISATLADVTNEQRTDSLGQVLATAGVDVAYVGMWSNRGVFHSSSRDTLDCTTYRAWAPGFPRLASNVSCVVLTRHRMWKSTSCKRKFQAICELIPGGSYRRGSIFSASTQNDTYTQAAKLNSEYYN